MNKKVVIVIVVFILAIGGYFGYNYLFKKPDAAASAPQAPKLEELVTFSAGDAFVTNIKDSKALCKISVSLAYSGEEKTEFLTSKKALIRSCILEVVRNHTEADLRAPEAPQNLAKEMVDVLKEKLEMDNIANVYISDYVVQ